MARPNPPALSIVVTGDASLAARARPLLSGALDRVSLAVIDGGTVTYAGFGADEQTEYEIGSLTKTMTAMLLADAIERLLTSKSLRQEMGSRGRRRIEEDFDIARVTDELTRRFAAA